VLLGAVTVVLVMFGALETPDDALRLAVYRSMEILVGVGVSYLVQVALAPPPDRRSSAPSPEFSPVRSTRTCSALPSRAGSPSPASR
jgi:hypothetical protein